MSLRVEKYDFGRMVIGGREYVRDVVVTPEKVYPNWWRERGHELAVRDIEEYIEREMPEAVVIGTGYYGVMQVRGEVREYLGRKGIKVYEARTGEAVKKFNELAERGVRVLGFFHLTC